MFNTIGVVASLQHSGLVVLALIVRYYTHRSYDESSIYLHISFLFVVLNKLIEFIVATWKSVPLL